MSNLDMYTTTNIMSFGSPVLENGGKNPPRYFETRETNKTRDIDGAVPDVKYGKYVNKPNLFEPSDIDGAKPKRIEKTRNVPDNSLYVDDIDGARTFIKDKMLRTGRHVNPLVPVYSLPSYQTYSHEHPKFLRNTLDVSDIDGAAPKIPRKFEPRVTMQADDIEGAQANWRPRHRRARLEAPPMDNMYIADITAKSKPFEVTNRRTNVMDPEYQIYGNTIKDDRHTKPKPLPKQVFNGHLLQTADINTASKFFQPHMRREVKNITSCSDIEGAQADTLIKSIVTKRETNPLMPVYQALDKNQLLEPCIQPLLPSQYIQKPTLKVKSGNSGGGANKDDGRGGGSIIAPTPAPISSRSGRENSGNGGVGVGPESHAVDYSQTLNNNDDLMMASFTVDNDTNNITNNTSNNNNNTHVPLLNINNNGNMSARSGGGSSRMIVSNRSSGRVRVNSDRHNSQLKLQGSGSGRIGNGNSNGNSGRSGRSVASKKAAAEYEAEIQSVRDL